MYSLEGYGKMASDWRRINPYLAALRQSVSEGSVVVDLGCGPGLFALHACRLGAARVYAIEPSDSIQIARDLAQANGLGSRIEFIQDLSTKTNLPERADVIVADLRGILPMYCASLSSMIDARQRFLSPSGVLIPARDRLWATVIESPGSYCRSVGAWDAALSGFDHSPIRQMAANTIYKVRAQLQEFLAPACELPVLDYASLTSPSWSAEANWNVTRDGVAHGILVWFDAELAPGIGFSNAPGAPEVLYGSAFFPFEEPLHVTAGESIRSSVRADLVGDDYVWRWKTSAGGTPRFDQSTFYGMSISADSLRTSPTQQR